MPGVIGKLRSFTTQSKENLSKIRTKPSSEPSSNINVPHSKNTDGIKFLSPTNSASLFKTSTPFANDDRNKTYSISNRSDSVDSFDQYFVSCDQNFSNDNMDEVAAKYQAINVDDEDEDQLRGRETGRRSHDTDSVSSNKIEKSATTKEQSEMDEILGKNNGESREIRHTSLNIGRTRHDDQKYRDQEMFPLENVNSEFLPGDQNNSSSRHLSNNGRDSAESSLGSIARQQMTSSGSLNSLTNFDVTIKDDTSGSVDWLGGQLGSRDSSDVDGRDKTKSHPVGSLQPEVHQLRNDQGPDYSIIAADGTTTHSQQTTLAYTTNNGEVVHEELHASFVQKSKLMFNDDDAALDASLSLPDMPSNVDDVIQTSSVPAHRATGFDDQRRRCDSVSNVDRYLRYLNFLRSPRGVHLSPSTTVDLLQTSLRNPQGPFARSDRLPLKPCIEDDQWSDMSEVAAVDHGVLAASGTTMVSGTLVGTCDHSVSKSSTRDGEIWNACDNSRLTRLFSPQPFSIKRSTAAAPVGAAAPPTAVMGQSDGCKESEMDQLHRPARESIDMKSSVANPAQQINLISGQPPPPNDDHRLMLNDRKLMQGDMDVIPDDRKQISNQLEPTQQGQQQSHRLSQPCRDNGLPIVTSQLNPSSSLPHPAAPISSEEHSSLRSIDGHRSAAKNILRQIELNRNATGIGNRYHPEPSPEQHQTVHHSPAVPSQAAGTFAAELADEVKSKSVKTKASEPISPRLLHSQVIKQLSGPASLDESKHIPLSDKSGYIKKDPMSDTEPTPISGVPMATDDNMAPLTLTDILKQSRKGWSKRKYADSD